MSASVNETLVRQAIEVIWNRGDLDAADELFAPGYVNHYGLIADLVLGPEAIKVSAALYRVAFPGLHVTVEELERSKTPSCSDGRPADVQRGTEGGVFKRIGRCSQGPRAADSLTGRSSRVGPNGIRLECSETSAEWRNG